MQIDLFLYKLDLLSYKFELFSVCEFVHILCDHNILYLHKININTSY